MAIPRGSAPANRLAGPAMAEENRDKGFLGRWAQRKNDALQGRPLDEAVASLPVAAGPATAAAAATTVYPATAEAQPLSAPEPPALSLEDVKLLTRDSDFKPFMAKGVDANVRNAAMKKLFSDPHFNVMDGLDIYIDDYSRSEPIPQAMLRQMVSAKALKLFDDEDDAEKNAAAALPRESVNNPTGQTVAQSYENPDITGPGLVSSENSSQPESLPGSGASQEDHADTDLRLQPDHAAPAQGAGRGPQ
ncbi:hypothetical protein D9M73_39060 [compost metagenome]